MRKETKAMNLLDVYEERLYIYHRDGGVCRFCNEPVSIHEFQVSHIIANAKWARKKYGSEVIDHPMNKACTHAGRCNDGMLITFKTKQADELADKIKREIGK